MKFLHTADLHLGKVLHEISLLEDQKHILKEIIKIAENEQAVNDFRNGKVKALQALFGACMKELKGAGDPSVIKELLENKMK